MADDFQNTGVRLSAEGFSGYFRRLQEIDKLQRQVFDKEFKGLNTTYAKAVSAAKQYEAQLKREEAAQARAAKAAERAADQKVKANERAARAALRAADQEAKAQKLVAQQQLRQNALIAAGVLFAAKQVFDFGKESLDLYRESAKAEAQVAAAIASTGGAAGQSVSGLKAHASALQDITNFDDEAVLGAQAMLLTFTNIGRDVFPEATEATLDLATAMGTDSKGAALQLGKALNDPIAGVNALRRSGVQFSDDQQKAIKALVETGQIAKAQAIILAEVNKEFGGSAEAARKADGGFTALGNAFGNLQEQIGGAIADLNTALGVTEALAGAFKGIEESIQQARVSRGGGSVQDQIDATKRQIEALKKTQEPEGIDFFNFGQTINQTRESLAVATDEDIDTTRGVAGEIEQLEARLKELLATEKEQTAAAKGSTAAIDEMADAAIADADALDAEKKAIEERNKALQAQQQIVRQAEQIQRSYTRALEDAARNQAKAQKKLGEQQTKARDKLLKDQIKEFDKFQADALKDIQKLETDRGKEETKLRIDAAKQQVDDQRKLQQQLRQAEEQFNLSRLQSKRRFQLQDKRLQAEGDILGLQQLREDFALQQQEEKESFNLSQSQTKDSAAQQQIDQARALDDQLKQLQANFEEQRAELTAGLDERRAELLTSFDEELVQLQLSQQEQRDELAKSYAEQLEDLRLSRQRQIEDLGASFVEQAGITQEGAQKIADELEKAFGEEGLADVIMAGFAERQASSFQKLFEDIGAGIEEVGTATDSADAAGPTDISRRYPQRQLQSFDGGGVVPGPAGSPQPILAHGGERVLTMQQQQVLAPAVTSATFRHELAGSLTVRGSGSISDAQIDVISERVNRDVVESFRQGLDRVKRRNN